MRNPLRRRKALTASPDVVLALEGGHSAFPLIATPQANRAITAVHVQTQAATYGYLYKKQPAVRKVVDYLARNVSQLGLALYRRADANDRDEAFDHPAAETMRMPKPGRTTSRFVFGMVADWAVYDNAYALKFRDSRVGRRTLIKIPPHAIGVIGADLFDPEGYRIYRSNGTYLDVEATDVIHWSGYDPEDDRRGYSKLETLRADLAEAAATQAAVVELSKSGLAQPGHIERPLEAPDWSPKARDRFEEAWANRVRDKGKHPVLEEGMSFKPAAVSPKDAEMLESRKFTVTTVAGLYGIENIPPADEDERRQMYADVLAPIVGDLTDVLNYALLDVEYGDAEEYYFEFNLADKLRGDAAERYKTLVSAAGAPILTRNEARARENLPAVEDGDELITPLNVTVGGKPSPSVMPIQDPNGPSQDGDERSAALELPVGKAVLPPRRAAQARRRDTYAEDVAGVLVAFLDRQERALKSRRFETKAVTDPRWRSELADDLHKAALRAVATEGEIAAARLGSDFDPDRTTRYLRAMADRRSAEITGAIEQAILAAEGADERAELYADARSNAAPRAGMTIATSLSAFAHREAAQQSPDADSRVKTWIVTSSNSRHPELDGETVPLGAQFSNGEDGPPESVSPGCQCLLEIS